MSFNTPRIVIIGTGIAGISLADALLRRPEFEGSHITMIGSGRPSLRAASATPMALLNPATGRDAKLISNAAELLPFSLDLLRRVQQWALGHDSIPVTVDSTRPVRFLFERGVLRPAPDGDSAQRMQQRHRQDPWPEGWSEWLSPGDAAERAPGVFAEFGALWISVGAHVEMPLFLSAAHRYLSDRGVKVKQGTVAAVRIGRPERGHRHEIDWIEESSGEDGMDDQPGAAAMNHQLGTAAMNHQQEAATATEYADLVLVAAGAGLTRHQVFTGLWPDRLGLHPVKGQILKLSLPSPIPFECAVSMRGYVAPMPAVGSETEPALGPRSAHVPASSQRPSPARSHLIIGSTFEHRFEDHVPDLQGRRRLMEIAASMMPGLEPLFRRELNPVDQHGFDTQGRERERDARAFRDIQDLRDARAIRDARAPRDAKGQSLEWEDWTGIRVHRPPDRLPVLASHSSSPSIIALTGFGSKGLMLAPFTACKLVERLAARIPWRRE